MAWHVLRWPVPPLVVISLLTREQESSSRVRELGAEVVDERAPCVVTLCVQHRRSEADVGWVDVLDVAIVVLC